jgi:dephospho-CoA kinase
VPDVSRRPEGESSSGPFVIGLTGPNAAGKGEAASYLQFLGFTCYSLSDVVREEAAAQGFPPEREHLIRIGTQLRREGGAGVLAERILSRLTGRAVVDSIRNPAEVEVLRTLPRFVLLGVDAPVEVRFQRSLARSRAGDPATLEEFQARETEENTADPNGQQLGATLRMSDVILTNNGELRDLRRKVDRVLADHGVTPTQVL